MVIDTTRRSTSKTKRGGVEKYKKRWSGRRWEEFIGQQVGIVQKWNVKTQTRGEAKKGGGIDKRRA